MATRLDELYETDFYIWTERRAEALRRLAATRPNVDLDLPPSDRGGGGLGHQRDAVRSQLRRIIEHCLKLKRSAATRPRGSRYDSIIDARAELDDKLSPALRRDLDQHLPRPVAQARSRADGLRRFGEPDGADLLRGPTAPTPSTTC